MRGFVCVVAMASCVSASAYNLESGEGDSVKVALSANLVLNGQSTLKREFHVIRDPSAPAEITGTPGVTVGYEPSERGYQYIGSFGLNVREPIVAIEYIAIVFDTFGRRVQTLRGLDVTDREPGQEARVYPRWRVLSEAEAKEAYGSLVYLSQIRTKSGKVYSADLKRIGELARKVSTKIKDADLVSERAEK